MADNPQRILVCVAWPYANGAIHIGHVAGSLLPGDIFARYNRMCGNDTIMVSGSDEHGTPITVRADKEGVTPQNIVDTYYAINTDAFAKLGIVFDNFFRTTDPRHASVVQDLFTTLLEKGHIYKKMTIAPHCPSCDRFLPDRYVEGTCPHCGTDGARGDQCDHCGTTLDPENLIGMRCKLCGATPTMDETEHFFFKLSAFSDQLQTYLTDKKGYWRDNAYNFTERYIAEGLQDRPITRDMTWGVPIPLDGYDDKRIYVWFEAVIGYLSSTKEWARKTGAGDRWKDFWCDESTKSYYFIGKDNIPFHTLIWPAMLMGYGGLNLPYDVPSNEFLTFGGEKFSKSKGIGMSVPEFLSSFEPDALRYYLSVNMPEGKDVTFSLDDFIAKNNDELVATLGNFIHRSLTFAQRYLTGTIPGADVLAALDDADRQALARIDAAFDAAGTALDACHFKDAIREVMALAQYGNQFIDAKAPWKLIKEDEQACARTIYLCLRIAKNLAILMAPFLPFAAQRAWALLGESGTIDAVSFEPADVMQGAALPSPAPLFKKIEVEAKEPQEKPAKKKGPALTFADVDLRVGKILTVTPHPDAEKLYVLSVDLGTEQRTLVAGLRAYYTAGDLEGKHIAVVANLEPANLRGVTSQGMLLAADKGDTVAVVNPSESAPGERIAVAGEPDAEPKASITIDALLKLTKKLTTDEQGAVLFKTKPLKTTAEALRADPAKAIGAGARIR